MAPGETAQVSVLRVLADQSTVDATGEVGEWRSTNEEVLTIGPTGVVTARRTGEASVTVQLEGRSGYRYVVVTPPGTFRISGTVYERFAGNEHAAVNMARVEVPGSGVSTTTNWNGQFTLFGVPGVAELRVTKDGFAPFSRELRLDAHQREVIVVMSASQARADHSGTYTFTIDAGDCQDNGTLPESVRRRTYTAVVSQLGPTLDVRLAGATFAIGSHWSSRFGSERELKGDRFTGRVDEDEVRFGLEPYGQYFDWNWHSFSHPDVVEAISGGFVVIQGKASARVTPSGFSGVLDGDVELYDKAFPAGDGLDYVTPIGACRSNAHRFTLTRLAVR